MSETQFVLISRDRLTELVESDMILDALYAAGIDNTGAYDEYVRVTEDQVQARVEHLLSVGA